VLKEYQYDGRGNLTHVTENGQLRNSYTFDATNKMTEVFIPGKGKAEYVYNGFMNRVMKLETLQNAEIAVAITGPFREVRYVLDMTLPYNNLLNKQSAGNQNFVWGHGLISANSSKSEERFYYLQDHLGSPVRLLGENNDIPLAYDEFGVPVAGAEHKTHSFNNPFGFTGYQTDNITGLYYAQARYYDPLTSRFISPDPHWNAYNRIYGDNPGLMPDIHAMRQSANLYAYVMNNPLKYFDPNGLISFILHDTNRNGALLSDAFFWGQVDYWTEQIKKAHGNEEAVIIIPLSSVGDFDNFWNNTPNFLAEQNIHNITEVVIIAHGSPRNLAIGDELISREHIRDLNYFSNISCTNNSNPRFIEKITISSCNTGHLNWRKDAAKNPQHYDGGGNIASAFIESGLFGTVRAYDGTLQNTPIFGLGMAIDNSSFKNDAVMESRYIKALGGRNVLHFEPRKPVGWVYYSLDENGNVIVHDKNNNKIPN